MNHALLSNGLVTATSSVAREGYTECPDQVECGWSYDGSSFAPPLGETIRLALLQEFGQEAPGVQAYFEPMSATLRGLLKTGQIAAAKQIILTAPIVDDLLPLRVRLLACFPQD